MIRNLSAVKDMIEYAGGNYTSYFTRANSVIICKTFSGEKYRTSLDWKVPAVSIAWLNEVLFGTEDVIEKVMSPSYRKISTQESDLAINPKLVSHLLEAWKQPIVVTKETYYCYREKLKQTGRKRGVDFDQTILTPDRKKVKLDPRVLFEKVT